MTAMHENDTELVRRALERVGRRMLMVAPLWFHVRMLFGVGPNTAWKLCRRFQFDPEEKRGKQ